MIDKNVYKFLKSCDKHISRSFYHKILVISSNPQAAISNLDIKALSGQKNLFRLRI